jgi:hypothetical protein
MITRKQLFEGSTHLTFTGLRGRLEHLKIEETVVYYESRKRELKIRRLLFIIINKDKKVFFSRLFFFLSSAPNATGVQGSIEHPSGRSSKARGTYAHLAPLRLSGAVMATLRPTAKVSTNHKACIHHIAHDYYGKRVATCSSDKVCFANMHDIYARLLHVWAGVYRVFLCLRMVGECAAAEHSIEDVIDFKQVASPVHMSHFI